MTLKGEQSSGDPNQGGGWGRSRRGGFSSSLRFFSRLNNPRRELKALWLKLVRGDNDGG